MRFVKRLFRRITGKREPEIDLYQKLAALSELIEDRLKENASNRTMTRELVLPAVTANS
jgi:hypothetical protein